MSTDVDGTNGNGKHATNGVTSGTTDGAHERANEAPMRRAMRAAMSEPAAGAAAVGVAARFHPAFAAARPSEAMLQRMAAVAARRVITTARWEPVRAIVQNYFVIPYQEFHFVNGCLVLGGANSTGKTSVLTSLITLVLDNDKRPQRFDPSGQRVRSIGYYVLGKPEMRFYHRNRISYIALEFRHTGTGEYRTIGIGIQGHRAGSDGQPHVDGWGFLLADGRRIGPDHAILLFDEEGDKRVPLSKARLIKTLGSEVNAVNRVVEDVDAYRDMVNTALFGFKSSQQFTDLMAILTQLRASKLANTIKPSAVNGFLQQSLRPLDEALMEEAGHIYERIDQYQERLELLESQVTVLDALANAEALWRSAAARREAGLYRDAYRDAERALKRLDRVRDDIGREQFAIEAAEQALTTERSKREKKIGRLKVLKDRDEYKNVEKLSECRTRLVESQALQARARAEASGAAERRDDAASRARRVSDAWTEAIHDIIMHARALTDDARSIWATAEAFASSVLVTVRNATVATPEIKPSVAIGSLLADYEVQRDSLQDIRRAIDQLDRADFRHRIERDHRTRLGEELTAAGNALQQRRDEEQRGRLRAAESLRLWLETSSADVPIGPVVIDDVVEQVLDTEVEPIGLTDPFITAIEEARSAARDEEAEATAAHRASEQHVRELEQRLREKEEEREETPPLRQERARAREALRMADVSATPLYQAVDFHVGTADATAGRLERILEDAGLLDALVVAPADAVRAHSAIAALPMDNRTAGIETWFASPIAKESPRGRTLADYLVVATDNASSEQPPNGLSAAIGSALRAVRVFEDSAALRAAPLGGGSAIALDGAWRHGALSGHTTGARERGRYIGLANRERARAEVIAQIKAELIEANGEHDRLERTVQLIAARLGTIESHNRSLRALPSLKGLPVLRSQVESANQDITKCEERLAEVERRVAQASKAVTDAKHHLDTACLAIPWTGERSKDAIERAITRLDRMRDAANGLQQRIDTTHRIAKDYAEAATRIPGLEESVKVAAGYVEERELAVARDAAQVQAIQDLLKRADVQQLTREISELEFAITQHGTAIDDQRSVRDKAEKALDIANEELPERESIDRAARSKAQSQLDHFVAALSAHPVTAEEAIRAREADAAAAAVADAMLKGLSSTDLGPAALDEARESAFNSMDRIRAQHTAALTDLQPAVDRVAGYTFMHHGRQLTTTVLVAELADEQVKLEATLGEDHRTLAQKFMSEEILSAIHAAIEDTNQMIDLVNAKLSQINSTKSKQLRFVWQPIALPGMTANVAEVAKLLGTKVTYWSDDDRATLVRFIEERLAYVRSRVKADDETVNYVEALKDALDYRNWYTFTMQAFTKRWAEFTDKEFGEGSEGEKAVDMLAPLFAVVHARYAVAASDAPRLIGMDEAMAGLDASNTRGLFALLANFEFAFAMTSEKLWGVSENLSGCATYQLQVDNPKDPSVFAATMFLWDGVQRTEDDHRVLNPSVSSGAAGGQGELVL